MRHDARSSTLGWTLFPPLANRYDKIAHKWHGVISRLGYISAYADFIRHAAPKFLGRNQKAHLSILDAGAGSGGFSLAFCDAIARDKTFVILDISRKMLVAADARLRARGQCARLMQGRISDGLHQDIRYDVVLCAHVIEHCGDPVETLRALRLMLAPQGTLLLVVSKPHWCTTLVRLWWHHQPFDDSAVTTMLCEAGFSPPEVRPFDRGAPKRMSLGYIAHPATSALHGGGDDEHDSVEAGQLS